MVTGMGEKSATFELVQQQDERISDYPGEDVKLKRSRRCGAKMCLCVLFVIIVLLAAVVIGVYFGVTRKKETPQSPESHIPSQEVPAEDRINCLPEGNVTETECQLKGCRWDSDDASTPCYVSPHIGYTVRATQKTEHGFKVMLDMSTRGREKRSTNPEFSHYSQPVNSLVFEVQEIDNNIVRFKVSMHKGIVVHTICNYIYYIMCD